MTAGHLLLGTRGGVSQEDREIVQSLGDVFAFISACRASQSLDFGKKLSEMEKRGRE